MGKEGNEEAVDRDALREQVRGTLTQLSRSGAIPALPAVATAALAIARAPDSNVDDLRKVVQTDVGLTARLLRVANSPGYGRRRQAQTVDEAIITVGLRHACSILVAVCARQLYSTPGPYTELLWNHSLAAALAAEELARVTRSYKADEAFLPGLFHDVGRIAFQLADATSFDVIQGLAESGEKPSAVLEREWYEFDHGQAGAILVEDWGLSSAQCDAIRWHHEPTSAGVGRKLATLLNAADSLVYTIGYGTFPEPPPDVGVASLGLSPEEEVSCADRVREAFDVHKQLIG